MSNIEGFRPIGTAQPASVALHLPPRALAGVRSRRVFAVFLDFILVSILSFALWLVLAVATLGWSIFILPPIFPLIAFFYNGLTVSSASMATPGMRVMDLEVRQTDGNPVPFLYAAVHAVFFYVSWMFPPVLLVSLLSDNKRCLHDMLAGVIVTRRPD